MKNAAHQTTVRYEIGLRETPYCCGFFGRDVEDGVLFHQPVDAVGEEVGADRFGGVVLEEFRRADGDDARGEHRGLGCRVGRRAAVVLRRRWSRDRRMSVVLLKVSCLGSAGGVAALADPAPRSRHRSGAGTGSSAEAVLAGREQRDRAGVVDQQLEIGLGKFCGDRMRGEAALVDRGQGQASLARRSVVSAAIKNEVVLIFQAVLLAAGRRGPSVT